MCGIAGFYSSGGGVAPENVEAVRRAISLLAHRGPDDSGIFHDARAVLGHRRLSILDLSPGGHQPMSTEDGAIWITFNGEIYNFRGLRKLLSDAGRRFRSRSDSEVLVQGYEEWGIEGLLARVRGMFAFAIYDARKSRLLLARDPFGIKPLYYAQGPENEWLAFASETKALTGSGLASPEVDQKALAGFLLFGSVPAPRTIRKQVRCLPAGHYMVFSQDGPSQPHGYWQSAQVIVDTGRPDISGAFREAVSSHLISDAPLGVFLSGGMDSAAIAAIASQTLAGPLQTLTIAVDENRGDEAADARKASNAFGANHHEVRIASGDFLRELPSFLASVDQPTNDGVNTWFISKAAREIGLKVVLSGLGGDEIFWGYRHYSWLEGRLPWLKILMALPAPLRHAPLTACSLYGQASGQEKWRRLSYLEGMPPGAGAYCAIRGFFPVEEASRLLGKTAGDLRDFMEELLGPGTGTGGAAFSRLEMQRYLHDQLLRDADVFSMAHSVETRVPFLDAELASTVTCLPACAKRPNGVQKPALLSAVPHAAVAAAARRKKRGFTLPLGDWLRDHSEPMRELALCSDLLDKRETAKLLDAFDAGRLHWSRAWALVVLGAAVRQ